MENYEFLSKEAQAGLKEVYKGILNDQICKEKAIDYHLSKVSVMVELSDGKLIAIEKENLQKEFLFGYSDFGQGLSYEEARAAANNVDNHIADWFKGHNLGNIKRTIEKLEQYINGERKIEAYIWKVWNEGETYYDFAVNEWIYMDYIREHGGIVVSNEDAKRILAAYQQHKENTEKRIDQYLKRYGTSKLNTRIYWVDE